MKTEKNKNEKTIRILTIYHLFRFCEEVSMEEIRSAVGEWNKKTILRDIAILKNAGVPIYYSNSRKAYITKCEEDTEGETQQQYSQVFIGGVREKQYIDKITRLTTMMSEMPYQDCDVWYRETFPDLSERTMKRDFAILKNVEFIYHDGSYEVVYKRAWEFPEIKDGEDPPGHYYFDAAENQLI